MDISDSIDYYGSKNSTLDNGGNNHLQSGSTGAKATTISTIVVRGGPIQMVIALLKSGDLYQIKVLEVEPKLTTLGDNIDEAVCLQREHDELLKQLQDTSTPVEEFIRKADKLVARHQASPQILDEMGQMLSVVWEDILKLVHDRKHLLDLCANFHEKMGGCRGKMASLEVACKDTMIPIEIDAVQEFLNKFKQLRIDVLTAIMSALKDGNELLARIQDMVETSTLDSRPDHIRRDATRTINQVQHWLEKLHDRRNMLESAWQTRKIQLEQCLALAILAKDLDELEGILLINKNSVSGPFSLGECEHTASKTLQEYVDKKHDALLLRDRALKITRTTEKLVSSGCFAGDEACSRAYSVLDSSTEFLEIVDQREHWLHQSKDFFNKAEKTLAVLEKLEIELSTTKYPTNSPEALAMYSKVLKDLSGFTEEPLRLGYSLLDEVGRVTPETQGIKRVLDEIENRKIYIEGMCSASSEQQLRVTEALRKFLSEYNVLLSWLVSIAEAFLRTNDSLGNNRKKSQNFLHLHHQLMQDLETKGETINILLLNIKQFLESLDAQQRYEVDSKAESLHKHWIELKEIVIKRVDLVSLLIEFYEKAEALSQMFGDLENSLKETPEEERLEQMESSWNQIKSSFGNLKALGMRFLNTKVADPYLETKSACSSVEEILNSFSNRQFDITTSWEKWTTNIIEKRETEILWERIMTETIETINTATGLDAQLYPVLTSQSEDSQELWNLTKEKLDNVLNDIEKALNEILERIELTKTLQPKDEDTIKKLAQVNENLQSMKIKLENVRYEYRTLLENILTFLDTIKTIRTTIEEYFANQPDTTDTAAAAMPTLKIDREIVIRDVADHEYFREKIMDKFRSLISLSEKLIERVRTLEPPGAREHDTDRILTLLEKLRICFEGKNNKKMSELQKSQAISNFDQELQEVNGNLDNLSEQLGEINGQYGETTASAKTTSLAFEYFERTIELLEKRIDHFIKTSENIYSVYADYEAYVSTEIVKVRKRWQEFRNKVRSTRNAINLTNEYFVLLDMIDTEYRDISAFYVRTVNKIPSIRQPVEAVNLINDIEKYMGEKEIIQNEKINKATGLSLQLYNEDRMVKIREDNKALFESFGRLKLDISIIEERLRSEEKMKELKELVEKQQEIIEIQNKKEVQEIFTQIRYEPPSFIKPLHDATIQEGERFIFVCEVKGNPKPSIEWFKDGISIQNNPDYHTTHDNGICTLSIEETFTEDSARFMCRASNTVGVSDSVATLSVKENTVTEQMTPPQILKYLDNGVAREGSSHKFSCVVSGHPLPTVQWFKNDKCIDDSPDYIITFNNGEAILKFEEVFLEDHAVYTCKATNPAGSVQCFASLNVEPLEPTEIPRFKIPLSNVMARVGQKIKLECEVTGIPRPELYWMHNGRPFSCRDAKYENERATLIIPEAYPKDAGTYIITAKNLAGETYSSCSVSVKGRLPTETSDSEMASDMEPIKPSVQLPLKDIAVFEGKSVRLDCVIIGQPEPEVIWYHNERPVKESADVQLLFQGDRCSLLVQEAYLEDAGEYKVVAINSAGEASSSCRLTVTPLNIAEPATRTQSDRILSNESPPKFEKFLSDVLADEGDTIVLECAVTGDPKPIAKWYLTNQELVSNDRIQFIDETGGVFKLIIKNVSIHDKGVYTVKVSNPSGDAKCFSHLNVKCINVTDNQHQRQQIEIEEKFVSPTFKELFSDKNSHRNELIKFECIVIGKPTPKIKWLFNDQPVHGKDFLVSTSGDRQVLTIPDASEETVGKIACVAENDYGKATCVAYLNMIGDGVQPSSVIQENMSQEHNTDSSIVTIKKQMFTTTSTSEISTMENGVPRTEIQGGAARFNNSFTQVGQETPQILESRQFQEYNKTSETPLNIQQKAIISIVKESKAEMPEKIVRKQIAPRFATPLIGKIVDQGANVTLEAVYDGYPTPDIKVQKNNEDLHETDRIQIIKNMNHVSIHLANVGVRDAGRYSITASNGAGTSTSTADVVVKKTIFPPVFGHRLQAQVAKRGERVVMDIEVTGTPDPTVTWYKDNFPLDQIMTSEYRLKHEGNQYTLIIEKVKLQDSGKYMVKATNAGGEAQSIADFAVLEPTPERMVEVVKTVVYDNLKDFKDEQSKPISNAFHTKKLETSTESDKHGTTESTIITEHRRTTEATMRMEHKPSNIDFPEIHQHPVHKIVPLQVETKTQELPKTEVHTQTLINKDYKTISTNTEPNKTKADFTQTPPPIPPKPDLSIIQSYMKPLTESTSRMETTTVTKQSAHEHFRKIEDNTHLRERVIPVEPEDKYTKYDQMDKSAKVATKMMQMQHEISNVRPLHILSPVPVQKPSEFILKPGTPPEIRFTPTFTEVNDDATHEDFKKIKENLIETLPIIKSPETVPQMHTVKEEYSKTFSKQTKLEYSSYPVLPKTTTSVPCMRPYDRPQSPKPSPQAISMEKLWASPKHFDHHDIVQREIHQESQKQKYVSYRDTTSEDSFIDDFPISKSIKQTTKIFEEKIKEEEPPKWLPSMTETELKAPSLVKQMIPRQKTPPKPELPNLIDLNLEPGPPPEFFFAPANPVAEKVSIVETVHRNLQHDIGRAPSKIVHGSECVLPPPLPPKDFQISAPPLPTRPASYQEKGPTPVPPQVPPKPKFVPPPPVPKNFVKLETNQLIYESECKKFSGSESDEAIFCSPKFAHSPVLPPQPKTWQQPQTIDNADAKQTTVSGYMADTEESVLRTTESRTVHQSKQLFESHSTQPSQIDTSPLKHYRRHVHKTSHPDPGLDQINQKGFSSSSLVKNISMTTKQVRVDKEPDILEPFPFKPEPIKQQQPVRVPPPPSPSKFVKGEFRESDFSSDYDEKIHSMWKPHDADTEIKGYRPIRPNLTPPGRRSNLSTETRSPIPPTEFDHPPKFDGPPRPKFEPIKLEEPVKVQPQTTVFKPKPVQGKFMSATKPVSPKPQSYTTQYYTAIAGPPVHHAALATETSNKMHMKESSETSHRVLNMSQTKRVIHFDSSKTSHLTQESEPISYSPSSRSTISPRPRMQLPSTPTKFIRGEFRESDYDSEIESSRIRPLWTPNTSECGEPQFRHVNPPLASRSASLPRSYGRVMTPMEFDTTPPEMPTKIPLSTPSSFYSNESHKSSTVDRKYTSRIIKSVKTTRDDMELQAGSPPKYGYMADHMHNEGHEFGSTLRKKTHQFINDLSSDYNTSTPIRTGLKRATSEGDNTSQAYREESRLSQYGTKHIDPDTGLIYFKYDFGYEFGIIFPGEGKKLVAGRRENVPKPRHSIESQNLIKKPLYSSDIIIPVQHERTTPAASGARQNESELLDARRNPYYTRKRNSLPGDINIDGLHGKRDLFLKYYQPVNDQTSNVPVNASAKREERPKRPPLFITPLKDIAVLIGQTARFECIVQCDPYPDIAWTKNGFQLQVSNKHIIEFRNGVCRLTIPQAFPDDSGTYTCMGTNAIGSGATSAELAVTANSPGLRF